MSQQPLVHFNGHDCSLLLSIPTIAIPEHILIAGAEEGLQVKTEFHISIVVSDNARRVKKAMEELGQTAETLQNLETLARAQDWTYRALGKYSLHEDVYSRERLERTGKGELPPYMSRSIIEQIDLPTLPKYYEGLSALLGIPFSAPFAHITLLTWSDYPPLFARGISISGIDDYERTLIREL